MSFKNFNVGMKIGIALGFSIIVSLLIGAAALYATINLGNVIHEVANVRLPSVSSLQIISEAQTAVDAAENSLLSQRITAEMRKESFQRFKDAWSRVDKAWKIYEPLPQSVEEKKVWDEFVPVWAAWKKDHETFVNIAAEYGQNQTKELYEKMSDQALLVNGINFGKAENLLLKIIEINEKIAVEEGKNATQVISFSRNLILIVALIGIIIAVSLGLFIVRGITGPVNKGLEFAKKIAEGDFTERIDLNQDDELGQLGKALNISADNLEELVSNIIVAAQNLAQAVEQIASGNQNLSQRTSEQASSLEEIASTIEETTATINQNADNANDANKTSQASEKLAMEGGRLVSDAVVSINEINQVSKKIGDIIAVINEIAFQTNLLALNAAVEAARAGEQGRGFAVVAGEVRNLAQRSGNAAKEIGDLIKNSIEKIEVGTDKANKSGEALTEIIQSVKNVNSVISEIAAASVEQKQGINQINIAVTEMDTMTQQNAALVEETASASEEMSNQAQELLVMMEKFKIRDASKNDTYSKKHKEVHLRGADVKTSNKKQGMTAIAHKQSQSGNGKQTNGIKGLMKDEGFEEF